VRGAEEERATVDNPQSFAHVSPRSPVVPVRITGAVEDPEVCRFELAIAVNGRVAALTRCVADEDTLRFRAIVPESVFRAGLNPVDVFAIRGTRSSEYLVPLGSTRG
jgi:hypothetical protein